MPDLGELHFHLLRHTFTTNLLTNGAAPKDVQELLGHSDVGTTMNIYAHANHCLRAHFYTPIVYAVRRVVLRCTKASTV